MTNRAKSDKRMTVYKLLLNIQLWIETHNAAARSSEELSITFSAWN